MRTKKRKANCLKSEINPKSQNKIKEIIGLVKTFKLGKFNSHHEIRFK